MHQRVGEQWREGMALSRFLTERVDMAKILGTEPSSVLQMLQESVGGSWMALLDEQCHKR